MKTAVMIYLLVLVQGDDFREWTTYETRADCMAAGARFAERSLRDDDDEGALYGFICEPQEPEKVTQVTPICLAPTRQCS